MLNSLSYGPSELFAPVLSYVFALTMEVLRFESLASKRQAQGDEYQGPHLVMKCF